MQLKNKFWFLMSFLVVLNFLGCGGGGGGGSDASNGPTGPSIGDVLNDPNTLLHNTTLADSGKVDVVGTSQGKINAITFNNISVGNRFGMVFSALTSDKGKYRIIGNGGGGTELASILQSPVVSDGQGRFSSQAEADQEMYQKRCESLRQKRGSLKPSVKADPTYNNSGEKIGDSVKFWAYSKSVAGNGQEYTQRTGILRRIGNYCKLFVDPDVYNGLSAVNGTYAITEAQLDDIQSKFDQYVYPLVSQGYGPPDDVDNDGKVTILFSPMYSKLGFAGLFDTVHIEGGQYSNHRDMIVVFTPYSQFSGSEWESVALQTTAHEFQHLANFSYRFLRGYDAEEVWLDEGLAVGAEARYRILTGDKASNDNRFGEFVNATRNTSLLGFSWQLACYGDGGMFTHYLFERGGADLIKQLVQSNLIGVNNINHVYSSFGGFYSIYRDWSMAVFTECHKPYVNRSNIDPIYKYSADLGLDLTARTNKIGLQDRFQTTLSETAMAFLIVQVPMNLIGSQMTMYYESPDTASMSCSIIKLN
ncbi:MAG: hypothetical protein HQM08_18715 [Candidatus Riflebacteria bacterium]|nr:hypothetical protein [Candidatus Riflebacteria bacterium]